MPETTDIHPLRLLITGGAGFIGSAVIRHLINHTDCTVLNVDCLTYAGNPDNLRPVAASPRYHFARQDICDATGMTRLFSEFRPDSVLHLAAESHVDRSIDTPLEFIRTNVQGTANLLQCVLHYWHHLPENQRFHSRGFG